MSQGVLPLDRPIAEGSLDKGGMDISDTLQKRIGGVFVDMWVVTSVADKAHFNVDTEWVDDCFVRSHQGEDCFGNGAVDLSFFKFV